jgi:hypothetical protein
MEPEAAFLSVAAMLMPKVTALSSQPTAHPAGGRTAAPLRRVSGR